jgi:tripartite-type tricarboxylate transporter receptor subunit TctC
MMKQFLKTLILATSMSLLTLISNVATAQTPLRIITSDQPGGGMDALIRPMADKLAIQLGRPVIVDNKPGAQGRIAGGALLAAPADGNTIMITVQASIVINPHVYKYPYAPLTDLIPITDLGNGSLLLLTPASLGPNNFKEFVAWAKAQPSGKINYGTYSPGTISHFGGMLLAQDLGLDMTAVHYKASAEAVKDLVPGVVNFLWSGPAGAVGQLIKAGRLKAHAYMGPKRLAAFPDVPTVRELGFADIESDGWIGVFAAKGTSSDTIAKLQSEIAKALNSPEIKANYNQVGFEPGGMGVSDFGNTVRADSVRWAAYIKKINYKPE